MRAISIVLVLLLAVACDSTRKTTPTGPTSSEGITVVSTTLEEQDSFIFDECKIRGSLQNDSATDKTVTVKFNALTKGGHLLATATTPSTFVQAGGRSTYAATFFEKCDSIDHVEVAEIRAEPA